MESESTDGDMLLRLVSISNQSATVAGMTPVETDHSEGLNGALAAELRAEIAAQRRTNTEVAETAGLKRVPFQRWINAERAITTSTADAICQALGVDTGEMYSRAVRRLEREKASNVVQFPAAPKPPTEADAHIGAQAAYRPKVKHESMLDDGDHIDD